ncbi:MAG: AarF/UbiB family protein [Planctomycetota bacterium]|nr:AarF/UbiB family protein [Planctomycetota bacterium]
MKISTIPKLYRNVRRWQEIIVVLRRYGLADWLSRLQLDFVRDWLKDDSGIPLSSYSRESRVRMALTELGPTFIKLGQVLSLRPDLVGSALATELQLLQTQVPPDPYKSVQLSIQTELGMKVEEAFASFDPEPMASASIGQVHKATLHDGTEVVVKVQHENIQSKVREDMEVLAGLAGLADRIPELAAWQPKILVEQLSKSLKRELSFTRELNNLQVFTTQFASFKDVRIPKPYPKLSTSHVLTMECLNGQSISQFMSSTPDDPAQRELELSRIPRRAAELYLEMIFSAGIYHADPHPGNVLILPDGTLGLLDFGMVGRIDDSLRETIEEMLLAVSSSDAMLLTSLIKRVGKPPIRLDDSALSIDVADLISTYGSQPLDSFDVAGVLNDMTDILHQHQISLPPQTAMLIKTLVTLEGTIRQLNPRFSLLEVMQPFFKKMWLRRLSPRRQVRRMRRIYVELEGLLEKMPGQVSGLMELVRQGKLDVHLSHRGLSPSINRLVLGLLTSSLLMGSSVLLAFKVPPVLFITGGPLGVKDLSLFGLLGFSASMLVSFRLWLAINKSGHLDPASEQQED